MIEFVSISHFRPSLTFRGLGKEWSPPWCKNLLGFLLCLPWFILFPSLPLSLVNLRISLPYSIEYVLTVLPCLPHTLIYLRHQFTLLPSLPYTLVYPTKSLHYSLVYPTP
jgi:hypothetical protein